MNPTPADRGFSEAADMYYEITEGINRKIEALKNSRAMRFHTGIPHYLYLVIIETLIDTYIDVQEIVNDVYAKHDDADYAGLDQ